VGEGLVLRKKNHTQAHTHTHNKGNKITTTTMASARVANESSAEECSPVVTPSTAGTPASLSCERVEASWNDAISSFHKSTSVPEERHTEFVYWVGLDHKEWLFRVRYSISRPNVVFVRCDKSFGWLLVYTLVDVLTARQSSCEYRVQHFADARHPMQAITVPPFAPPPPTTHHHRRH